MNITGKNNIQDSHPDHEDIALVADGNASAWLRESVLEHTDNCERCRFVLSELARNANEIGDIKLPPSLTEPIKLDIFTICPSCNKRVSASGEKCPECGKSLGLLSKESKKEEIKKTKRPWRRQGDTTFFWIAGCFFFLSLIFPKYGMHLLAVGAFFGVLAIIDYSSKSAFAVLIRAWREGDEEKAAEAIDELKERFKIG